MSHRVGIDLGTTNSAIAFTELGKQRCVKVEKNEYTSAVFPSCVGIGRDGQTIYGALARREPSSLREFKRAMGTGQTYQLGDRIVTPTQLSALLLSQLKAGFERECGPCDGAVITVPANFDDHRRAETREAGRLAGLDVLRVINEPSAAAIAYSLSDAPPGENSVVIDWGGGTLDVSLIDCMGSVLDVKANDGDERCGGKDVDSAILTILRRKCAAELGDAMDDPRVNTELLLKCEAIKIHLSEERTWDEPIDVRTRRMFLDFELTRDELEAEITPLVDRVIAAVERCLRKCPEGELAAREVTDVILVGGSCYLPLLRRRVERLFGQAGRIDLDPMEVVALGAAYQAEHADETGSLVTIHSLTKSLGVSCVGADSMGILRPDYFAEILPATTKLPARATHEFATIHDNQEGLEVRVYENGDGRETVEGLEPWCVRHVSGLLPRPAGSFPVQVTFDYSVEQTLTVTVAVPDHGISETWKADHVLKIEGERAHSEAVVEEIRSSSLEALAAFVDRVRSTINGRGEGQIRELLASLEQAIDRGDVDAARRIKDELGTALFDAGIHL